MESFTASLTALTPASCIKDKITSRSSDAASSINSWINKVKNGADQFEEVARETKQERERQKNQRRMAAWVSAQSEGELLEKQYGPNNWHIYLLNFLQSRKVQLLLTSLLCFDIIIVVAELFVEAEYPSCAKVKRDAVSCCASLAGGGRRLAGGGGGCPASLHTAPDFTVGCDSHKYPAVHVLHNIMFFGSTSILAFFEIELLLLLIALGYLFFMNPLYLLDMVVVTASLAIDIHTKFGAGKGEDGNATILIVARCWRFIRIGHGIMSSTHEADMKKIEEILEMAKEMQNDSEELNNQLVSYHGFEPPPTTGGDDALKSGQVLEDFGGSPFKGTAKSASI